MPYLWTEPNLVVEYQGVSVYSTYKDGNMDRPFDYHYTTDITEQATPFDIRDLKSFSTSKEHSTILKLAIERGEVSSLSDEEV